MRRSLAALALTLTFAASADPVAFVAVRGNATIEGDGAPPS
jgi:hypothetical protein